MVHLIDKDAVVAEIVKMLQEEYPCDNSEQTTGYHCALYELQYFLNTIGVKEPQRMISAKAKEAGYSKPARKDFTFKSIPRILKMVNPSERTKSYCEKLAKSLENEGYPTDAKVVRESIKMMNGEKVPMATMDEEAKQFAEEYSFNIESDLYQTLTNEQRDSWKKEIENAIKAGVSWQTERFENNRVNAFKNQTEEEAEREMNFATNIIEKEHRTPTYDDAIKYGMRLQKEEMMKDIINAEVAVPVYEGKDLKLTQLVTTDVKLNVGDKVKLIIIKD